MSELSVGAASAPSPKPGAAQPVRFKYRVRFRKAGDLRLVSHHDLMHVFERLFRRADLPVPRTQGFNPRPRMWFALSLALGVVGLREVLELELTEPLDADEVGRRLAAHAPPGIEVLTTACIEPRGAARVRRAIYRLPLAEPPADLAERCASFLAEPHFWIERSRPHHRRLDLRPYASELCACADGLEMALWITPNGAARPEEIVEAMGLASLLQGGASLERTDLELYDELPQDAAHQGAPPVPAGTSEILPATDRDTEAEGVGARPHVPLLPGPLSFDS